MFLILRRVNLEVIISNTRVSQDSTAEPVRSVNFLAFANVLHRALPLEDCLVLSTST